MNTALPHPHTLFVQIDGLNKDRTRAPRETFNVSARVPEGVTSNRHPCRHAPSSVSIVDQGGDCAHAAGSAGAGKMLSTREAGRFLPVRGLREFVEMCWRASSGGGYSVEQRQQTRFLFPPQAAACLVAATSALLMLLPSFLWCGGGGLCDPGTPTTCSAATTAYLGALQYFELHESSRAWLSFARLRRAARVLVYTNISLFQAAPIFPSSFYQVLSRVCRTVQVASSPKMS